MLSLKGFPENTSADFAQASIVADNIVFWKLNFEDHISDIRKKVCGNLTALARIALFIGSSKRRILMNVFLILDLIIVPLLGCIT